MAEIKKAATVKPVEKTEVVTRPVATVAVTEKVVKAPEKKEETKQEVKAAVKTETKAAVKPAAKATEKVVKAPAKKAPVKKAAEKKPAAKPAAKAPAKKAEAKKVINLQFAGKSYSVEDIVKIAEDVWKFDLHKSDEAYESLELYVKPEESVAYYVFNGEVSGSFFI